MGSTSLSAMSNCRLFISLLALSALLHLLLAPPIAAEAADDPSTDRAPHRLLPPLPASLSASSSSPSPSELKAPRAGELRFRLQTLTAAWLPRFKTSVDLLPRSVSATTADNRRTTFPAGSFILHGGEVQGSIIDDNSVWLSSNLGAQWSLVAGRDGTQFASSPADSTSFTNQYAVSAFVIPSTGSVLRVGGIGGWRTGDPDIGNSSWAATSTTIWTDRYSPSRGLPARAYYSSQVTNSLGHLIIIGGARPEIGSRVVMSSDSGATWRVRTVALPFGPRLAAAAVHWRMPPQPNTPPVDPDQEGDGGVDVIIHVAGEGAVGRSGLTENFNDGQCRATSFFLPSSFLWPSPPGLPLTCLCVLCC